MKHLTSIATAAAVAIAPAAAVTVTAAPAHASGHVAVVTAKPKPKPVRKTRHVTVFKGKAIVGCEVPRHCTAYVRKPYAKQSYNGWDRRAIVCHDMWCADPRNVRLPVKTPKMSKVYPSMTQAEYNRMILNIMVWQFQQMFRF